MTPVNKPLRQHSKAVPPRQVGVVASPQVAHAQGGSFTQGPTLARTEPAARGCRWPAQVLSYEQQSRITFSPVLPVRCEAVARKSKTTCSAQQASTPPRRLCAPATRPLAVRRIILVLAIVAKRFGHDGFRPATLLCRARSPFLFGLLELYRICLPSSLPRKSRHIKMRGLSGPARTKLTPARLAPTRKLWPLWSKIVPGQKARPLDVMGNGLKEPAPYPAP